ARCLTARFSLNQRNTRGGTPRLQPEQKPSGKDMNFRLSLLVLSTVMAAAPVRAQAPSTTRVPAAGGEIVITALGHASVQIEHGGKVIIVDPVANQADLSQAKPADLILVTDIHSDHLDPGAIAKLRKPRAPVVIPPDAMAKVPDGIVMRNREML